MTRTEIAVNKFLDGYNCAQAVSYAFAEDFHIDKDIILKLSCGFGAGMGRKEEVCGAVSGGILVLGMKYGRGEDQERDLTDQTYQKTRDLMDGFTEKHGAFICRKLLGNCELTTAEGQNEFKEKDFKHKICKHCVSDVVEIVERIIK